MKEIKENNWGEKEWRLCLFHPPWQCPYLYEELETPHIVELALNLVAQNYKWFLIECLDTDKNFFREDELFSIKNIIKLLRRVLSPRWEKDKQYIL